MEPGLFRAAAVLYGSATGLAMLFLYRRDERLTLWLRRLLACALVLHLASFALRLRDFWALPDNRFFLPVHTFYGFLSWVALTNAAIFLAVENAARLHILGAFVLPWTLLAAAAAFLADPTAGSLPPALRSYNLHPMVLMAAYSGFANAAGVGLALIIQERQIRSCRPMELCYRLPSIEELDALHHRIVHLSFLALTVGVLMGVSWAHVLWVRHWGGDPKVLSAAATWSVYAAYLLLRRHRGLRGRRSVYVASLGFASVLFTFFGINYLSRLHGFLRV